VIEGPTDKHLWAENYQREMRSILALTSEVAQAIASEIKIKVTPQEQTRLASVRPVDPKAHEAVLKGRYDVFKGTEKGSGFIGQGKCLGRNCAYLRSFLCRNPY
jgi:hypothetical protein